MAIVRRWEQDDAGAQPAAKAKQRDDVFDHLQNRILTHYPAMVQIKKREMPAPRTAIVYPTYICNQHCTWCEYNPENAEHHTMMSADQLQHVVAELHALGVQGVEFCGGGEPSLHPTLAENIRDLARRGMSVGILTNGTKLKGDLAEALVDHASYVRVGFDGATAETVHKVKRPRSPEARFGAVCENFRNMIAMRDARGTKCRISMKVVLDRENYHELEQCVELACDLRADSVQFKAARVCDTELNATEAQSVNTRIAALKERYRGRMVIIGGAEKLDIATKCWLTPLQLTIDTLGEIFLCCYYRHRKDKHSIGNVFAQPLQDLWYSESHWQKIDAIEPRECNNLDCRFVRYNKIMDRLMDGTDDAQFEFI